MTARATPFLVLMLVLASCTSAPVFDRVASRTMVESTPTTSPSGQITIEVGLTSSGEPVYRVEAGGIEVIGLSRLGLETSAGSLATNLTVADAGSSSTIVDSFELPTGKTRQSETAANVRTIVFESPGDLVLEIDVWASNDAAAFRSRVVDSSDGASGGALTVEWDRSSFSMPETSNTWLLPYDRPTRFTPAYEAFFTNGLEVDNPGDADGGWGFPALFQTSPASSTAPWVLLTEAGLTADYAGSRLGPETADGEFVLSLPDQGEGDGFGERAPTASLPITTPWRVAIIGDLQTIVASNAVRHLGADPTSSPEAPPDWIAPGRVSWSWWADHDSSRNPQSMAAYVEFAAEIGWEYSLIDANWNEIPADDLQALVDLADRLGVGLFLWYNSGGPNNPVTEAPRDLMFDSDLRRAEFARIAELGIVGVKVDFFHSDKQESIARYIGILEDAAEFELLVNFHGSTIPRGWERQYPNLMTMESVRGAETYTFDPRYAANAATHNTILPFTRNVIGSMDYTPVIFSDEDSHGRLTTDGHELALSVVFESGLQHFADTPESYRSQPPSVVEFLADVPAVWDETVLLAGTPGSHVVIARRQGETWWLGAINGTSESIDVAIDLELLDQQTPLQPGDWLLMCDAVDPNAGLVEANNVGLVEANSGGLVEINMDPTQSLELSLMPYGGCVARS